ncbi:Ig-like domain-containing protein, partial [Erysipelotrichaceae bacterium OttesenSCG-928-M19]|nr:Ig-like domain-containing protein [Erysipelotrichaceae bacterium OttesenSCG-928-M19]
LSNEELEFVGNSVSLTQYNQGLASSEYFTKVVVEYDTLEKGFKSGGGTQRTEGENIIFATLVDGVDKATINYKTYKSVEGVINDTTIVEATSTLTRSTPIASNQFNISAPSNVFSSGTEMNISQTVDTSSLYYSNILVIEEPTMIIKLPEGVTLDKDSVKIIYPGNKEVAFDVSDPYIVNDEEYVEISFKQPLGGYYLNDDGYYVGTFGITKINYTLKSTLTTFGIYNWSDLVYTYDKSGKVTMAKHGSGINIKDINDINRNGKNDDTLNSAYQGTTLNIQPFNNVIIDTYIKASKYDDRSDYYDKDNPDSAISFTPGTEAIYTMEVFNNRDQAAKVKTWIPVPKEGTNYGEEFQEETTKWNMKLGSVQPVIKVYQIDTETGAQIDVTSEKAKNYELSYSTDPDIANNYEKDVYSSTFNENANMIQLVNNVGIDIHEKAVIEFVYVVDETAESVKDTDKLGAINDFKPYYYYDAGMSGYGDDATKVGANLVIGEISGIVFKDENKDGLYGAGDGTLGGIEVTLFKLDANGDYQPYIDPATSNQIIATTNSSGEYKFINLPNGNYKIDFSSVTNDGGVFTPKNVGNDYKFDSDVFQAGDLTGMAEDIDPTKDTSKYIYAGLLEYNPPVDLKLSTDKTSVTILGPLDGKGVTNNTTVNAIIEPSFFETISDKTYDEDGVKAESSSRAIASVGTNGTITSGDSNVTTPITITGVSAGTATVTVSIKDLYGQIKEAEIEVIVKPNSTPVIEAEGVTLEAGDISFTGLLSLASVSDAEDGTTDLEVSVKADGGFDINKVGEYTVVYESNADKDGNKAVEKTITVIVEDTTAPELEIASKDDLVINPTEVTLSATDNADGEITYNWEIVDGDNETVDSGTTSTITLPTEDGVYTVTATATDESGNVSEEQTFTFTIDNTAPVASIEIEPTTKINPTKVELSATDTIDEAPLLTYILTKDGEVVASGTDVASPQDILAQASEDGVYTVELSAKDAAGNVSETLTDTFTVDTVAPTVEVEIAPTSKINPTEIVISATDAIDEAPLLTYTLTKDGEVVASGTDVASPQDILAQVTEDGVYTLEVSAKDAAGNISETITETFTIDTTAPVIETTIAEHSVKVGSAAISSDDLKTIFGVSATDAIDGEITDISVTGSVNVDKVGEYTITF